MRTAEENTILMILDAFCAPRQPEKTRNPLTYRVSARRVRVWITRNRCV